jgi:hypothetical protein
VLGSQFATATRDSSGDLRVTNWIVGSGTVTRGGHAILGSIKQVAIIDVGTVGSPPHTVYGTAAINGSGNYEFTEWSVLGNSVTELGSGTAGKASHVVLCQGFPDTITAIVNGSGNLSVEQWDTATTPFSLAATHNSTSPITAVAVAPDAFIGSMVTAARSSSGLLEVTVWQEM